MQTLLSNAQTDKNATKSFDVYINKKANNVIS